MKYLIACLLVAIALMCGAALAVTQPTQQALQGATLIAMQTCIIDVAQFAAIDMTIRHEMTGSPPAGCSFAVANGTMNLVTLYGQSADSVLKLPTRGPTTLAGALERDVGPSTISATMEIAQIGTGITLPTCATMSDSTMITKSGIGFYAMQLKKAGQFVSATAMQTLTA